MLLRRWDLAPATCTKAQCRCESPVCSKCRRSDHVAKVPPCHETVKYVVLGKADWGRVTNLQCKKVLICKFACLCFTTCCRGADSVRTSEFFHFRNFTADKLDLKGGFQGIAAWPAALGSWRSWRTSSSLRHRQAPRVSAM